MPLEGLPDGVIYSGEIVHNGPAMRKNKTANPGINLRALRWPVTTRVGLLLRELACYYEKSIRRDRTGLRFRLCPGCQAIVLTLNCCHSWRVDYWTRDYLTSKHRKRTGRRTVMDKMLVAVFDSDAAAFDGLTALRDLHRDGDITLYGYAVIVKDKTGKISVRQAPEEGGAPFGAALGLLTGKLLEVLRGPAGLAIGASLPGLTGFLFDLDMSRLGPKFLDEVVQALTPGKAAVLV